MREIVVGFIAVLYLAFAVLTFGHAATHCHSCRDGVDQWGAGFVSGLTWPFYWSWVAQDGR